MSDTLRITFAGSGDAFGSGGRFQACIVVSDGADTLLLDCGATSLTALKRAGVAPNSVGHVAVSHLHGDHFGGLPFLVLDGQFSRREEPLTILGPVGTTSRLNELMEASFPGSTGVQRRFQTRVVEVSSKLQFHGPPGATFVFFPADHASGAKAHAIRLKWHEKVIAYSGDTAWTDELIEVSRGADLFVCEAYFKERRVPYHLSYAELFEQRGRLDCGRIVLTHMTTEMIAADEIEFERAYDGLVVEV